MLLGQCQAQEATDFDDTTDSRRCSFNSSVASDQATREGVLRDGVETPTFCQLTPEDTELDKPRVRSIGVWRM